MERRPSPLSSTLELPFYTEEELKVLENTETSIARTRVVLCLKHHRITMSHITGLWPSSKRIDLIRKLQNGEYVPESIKHAVSYYEKFHNNSRQEAHGVERIQLSEMELFEVESYVPYAERPVKEPER